MAVDPGARHCLAGGCGRDLADAGAAHRADLRRLRRLAGGGHHARILRVDAVSGGRVDRALPGTRHGAVLRVLRPEPRRHVLPDRALGSWRGAGGGAEILHLHAGGFARDPARHHRDGALDAGTQLRHAQGHPRAAPRRPGRGVDPRRLHAGICREDAALSGAHLAAAGACGRARPRFRHPGRDPAQDGDLRHHPVSVPDDAGHLRRRSAVDRRAGRDLDPLGRAGGAGASRT